jgi:hypothetical protein
MFRAAVAPAKAVETIRLARVMYAPAGMNESLAAGAAAEEPIVVASAMLITKY